MKKSEVKFVVELDNNKVPEKIQWDATDNPEGKPMDTKAISLAIWDDSQFNTMRMDLWTKEMTVHEMRIFYLNAIGGMAQSLEDATGDTVMAQKIKDVCTELVSHVENN